jgi:hypothetical protein
MRFIYGNRISVVFMESILKPILCFKIFSIFLELASQIKWYDYRSCEYNDSNAGFFVLISIYGS